MLQSGSNQSLRSRIKHQVFIFHEKASIVFVQTYNILCIQPGALVQTMGKARYIGTLN